MLAEIQAWRSGTTSEQRRYNAYINILKLLLCKDHLVQKLRNVKISRQHFELDGCQFGCNQNYYSQSCYIQRPVQKIIP